MVKHLFASLFLLLSASALRAQWLTHQFLTGVPGVNIRYVSTVNSQTVWAVTGATAALGPTPIGFVRTADNGANWQKGAFFTTSDWAPTGISAIDADKCWVTAYNYFGGGKVFKTTNGGTNWTDVSGTMFAYPNGFPNGIHFFDASNGVIFGDPNTSSFEIWVTTNGGNNWSRVPSASIPAPQGGEYGVSGVHAALGDRIWFGTDRGRIFRSTDKGLHWQVSSTPLATSMPIGGIAFRDAMNGLAVGGDGSNATQVLSTSDGGATWTLVAGANTGSIKEKMDLAWAPNSQVWIIGSGFIDSEGTAYSADGVHWGKLGPNPCASLDFRGNGGWMADFDAPILYQWTSVVGTSDPESKSATIKVFPNPATDRATIQFPPSQPDANELVAIRLSDAWGRPLLQRTEATATLSLGYTLDLGNVPPGIYQVTATSKGKTVTSTLLKQ